MAESQTVSKDLRVRLELYAKAIELMAKGLSYSRVGKELGVSADTVRAWVRGAKPKRVAKYEPDLRPSKDLAYVAGFYLGDGKYAGEEHKVRFGLADRGQLEYVGGWWRRSSAGRRSLQGWREASMWSNTILWF